MCIGNIVCMYTLKGEKLFRVDWDSSETHPCICVSVHSHILMDAHVRKFYLCLRLHHSFIVWHYLGWTSSGIIFVRKKKKFLKIDDDTGVNQKWRLSINITHQYYIWKKINKWPLFMFSPVTQLVLIWVSPKTNSSLTHFNHNKC